MATVLLSHGQNTNPGAGNTRYFPMGNFSGTVAKVNEVEAQLTYHTAGTLRLLLAHFATNATTADSTIRVRKNGADGNLNLTIGAGGTGDFEDTSNSDTVADGDEMNYRLTQGTGGNISMRVLQVTWETAGVSVIHGTSQTSITVDSVTRYQALARNNNDGVTTETAAQAQLRNAGTLRNLFMYVTSNARTTNTTLGIRINGATGNLTTGAIGSGATGVFEDTVNTDTVAAGDLVNVYCTTGSGGGTLNQSFLSVQMDSSGTSWSQGGGGSSAVVINDGETTYNHYGDQLNATESTYRADVNLAVRAKNLWVYVTSNSTTSPSTFTLRKNGTDSVVSVSIGAGATGELEDTTHTDDLAADDEIDYQWVNGGGGGIISTIFTQLFDEIPGVPSVGPPNRMTYTRGVKPARRRRAA